MIGTCSRAGQVTVPWSRSMPNRCLVKCPAGAVGRPPCHRGDATLLQVGQQDAGAIGGIAVDDRCLFGRSLRRPGVSRRPLRAGLKVMLAMIAGLHSPRRKPQINAKDQVSAPTSARQNVDRGVDEQDKLYCLS
jgi:hypothetical protein